MPFDTATSVWSHEIRWRRISARAPRQAHTASGRRIGRKSNPKIVAPVMVQTAKKGFLATKYIKTKKVNQRSDGRPGTAALQRRSSHSRSFFVPTGPIGIPRG